MKMNTKPTFDELEEFDLGFTTFDVNEIEEVKEYQERLSKLRKMVIPFLDNLMKNPEKDIHWPDRDIKLAKFKKQFEDVIDYGRVLPIEEVVIEEPRFKIEK
jgi:hypothetical protein